VSVHRRSALSTSAPTALVVCALVAGCWGKTSVQRFDVITTAATNDRSAVPVDFVLVRDEGLIPILGEMRAREWFFEKREQMLLDHPEGLEAHRMDFVPGRSYRDITLRLEDVDDAALFVFVRFLSDGVHRVRLDFPERFEMILGTHEFTVRPIR
jgi:type VI secretion system protein